MSTWREYLDEVNAIEDELARLRMQTVGHYSNPLYRGHSSADWKLETTLEREVSSPMTMNHYQLSYVRPAHTLLTGFGETRYPFNPEADCSYAALGFHRIPNYEFMGYLRHHGFPSPLLDWTSSPYVAAFFAFDTAYSSEEVAIFCYQEFLGRGKSTSSDQPRILTAGPIAAIHRRHFLQQSEYTLCYHKNGKEAIFASHETFLSQPSRDWPQDYLRKFTLPRSLRTDILCELNKMNINPYSVYQSEESLVRTVGNRLFLEDERKAPMISIHKEIISKAREAVDAPWTSPEDE